MIPLVLGAAALAGGAYGAYSNSQQNSKTQNALDGVGNAAQQSYNNEMGVANNYDWQSRLNAANSMTRDMNNYEQNAAIQGGLSAFGGSPLSGNARNAVYDRLQQNARSNWQQGLDNANSMLGNDLNTQLGIQQRLNDSNMQVASAKADAKIAEKSGVGAFLGGAGQGLNAASKLIGMG